MATLSADEQNKITQAISLAENKTSGEIRLVVERKLGDGSTSFEKGLYYFEKLGMHKTQHRNGVLIYIALDDQALSIIGDEGINEKVGDLFWQKTKDIMINKFKENKISEGLIDGIYHIGEQLQCYFPARKDDVNELPDDIYFGNS